MPSRKEHLKVDQASAAMADRANKPGELMRLVADGLAGKGFEVRLPEWEDGRRLAISYHGSRCELTVDDCAYVVWDLFPWASDEADPKRVADLTTALLTGRAGDYPRRGKGYDHPGITFKGIVGLEAKARGLSVELEVYGDDDFYEAVAEIVVTNPGTGDVARVRVTDGGDVSWERDYWPEAAAITWEPEYTWWITDLRNVADCIVTTITQAMSHVIPAGR